MQPTGFTNNTSNYSPFNITLPARETKKRALERNLPDLQAANKKPRYYSLIIKTPLPLHPATGTTPLHIALQEMQYEDALAIMKKHSRLNVVELKTGWTPLHCLFCCAWTSEQFFSLFNSLLNGGCQPNVKTTSGKTFLDYLANSNSLSPDHYNEICKTIASKGYVFYDPKSDLPQFLLETAEAHFSVPIPTRVAIIKNYFNFIPMELKQQAAERLFRTVLQSSEFGSGEIAELTEGLLNAFGEDFNPAEALDEKEANLCFYALSNCYTGAEELARIIHILHQHGVSTKKCTSEGSVFECIIAFRNSFHFKKELIRHLMAYGIQCTITRSEDDSSPTHVAVIEYLIRHKLAGNEITEIMRLVTNQDWYREFLLMKLIANCYSVDLSWDDESGSVELSGARGSFKDFFRWLETDALEFYESKAQSSESADSFLQTIASQVSDPAQKTLRELDQTAWINLLRKAGGVLNHAFIQNSGDYTLTTLLEIQGLHAVVSSLKTDDPKANHMIGLLFRGAEVFFCNRGDDLTRRSGISRHVLSDEKMNTVFQQAHEGVHLYSFIREHFLERIQEVTGQNAPFIVDQKQQQASNCPVASFSSLELGLIVALLKEQMPLSDHNIVIEIARKIKKAHRSARRSKLIEEYRTFHAGDGANIPSQISSETDPFGAEDPMRM
ncbi:hypothetical protein [Estrella lausannensis]|uniref:Uncharacterized protein n=1 Tax=Estrella lausannensis TaxID=483423 RepID=A0A0H5DS58_9BACT|nr:hypothetical protein [Estrella lausannensis]CRX39561.1 hypothetical protein ELAC_2241 [Estrella lausannensis]